MGFIALCISELKMYFLFFLTGLCIEVGVLGFCFVISMYDSSALEFKQSGSGAPWALSPKCNLMEKTSIKVHATYF